MKTVYKHIVFAFLLISGCFLHAQVSIKGDIYVGEGAVIHVSKNMDVSVADANFKGAGKITKEDKDGGVIVVMSEKNHESHQSTASVIGKNKAKTLADSNTTAVDIPVKRAEEYAVVYVDDYYNGKDIPEKQIVETNRENIPNQGESAITSVSSRVTLTLKFKLTIPVFLSTHKEEITYHSSLYAYESHRGVFHPPAV